MKLSAIAITTLLLLGSTAVVAQEYNVDFRYRAELVDQDGISEEALASTLRTRLNYRSDAYQEAHFFIEIDNVSYLGAEQFNNTRNGNLRFPGVADPDGTSINQFYIARKTEKYSTTLGRHRILQDGQRFIGGVGWRQNEQTYDGLGVSYQPNLDTELSYHYINNVSRIFGPDSGKPSSSLDGNFHLLHSTFQTPTKTEVKAYGYWLDFDDTPSMSIKTLGISAKHIYQFDAVTIPVRAEYARQSDHADSPSDLTNYYFALNAVAQVAMADFQLGAERLSGSRSGAFSTPFATLHKYQGWADKFLSTPLDGIDDVYLGVSKTWANAKWNLFYHNFNSHKNSRRYGRELDFSVSKTISEHFSLALKLARFEADKQATNTTKAWITLAIKL